MQKNKPIDLICKIDYIFDGNIEFVLGNVEMEEIFYGEFNSSWGFPTFFYDLVRFAELVRSGESGAIIIDDGDHTHKKIRFSICEAANGFVKFEVYFSPRIMPGLNRLNELRYENDSTTREDVLAWLHEFANKFVDHKGFAWEYLLHSYGNAGRNFAEELPKAELWLKPKLEALNKKYEDVFAKFELIDSDDPGYWKFFRTEVNKFYVEQAELYCEASDIFFVKTEMQVAYLEHYRKILNELKMDS